MAGSAVVGILRVLLTANTAEFETAMKQASASADAWAKDLKSIGQQATNVGSTLTKALTLPLVAIGGSSIKAAMDFESSFAGIRKTVDGVVDSSGNLTAAGKDMQQAMRDLAKTIPVNVNDLNRLGEAAGALGIPRDKIVEFASVMAKLGVTTNLTADAAADAIARIQNIFGAAGKDTDRLASTLVALGNAGASTEKEIVEMAQRIAGAGHSVGLTQAQVLAFASTLASVGINAEAGGSAISKVFLKINDAVQKGGHGLAEFGRVAGMSAADFKKAFEADAATATQKFIEGLARLKASGENVNGTIEGLIGKNIILKDTLLRVSGAGSLLNDQLKLAGQAWQDNTALTKEAEQRFKTTESQLALLWNRIKDVGITIGGALLPAVTSMVKAFDLVLPLVSGLADGFAKLPGAAQAVIVGLGLIAAAAGPVIYAFGQIAISASGLIGIFGKKGIATRLLASEMVGLGTAAGTAAEGTGVLAAALGVLTSPITLAVAAVGLLAFGIYKVVTAQTDLEKSFQGNREAFKKHTDQLGDALKTYDELSHKQGLTKDETARLDEATRALANASGLSKDAFEKEASGSSTLTDELRKQLSARKELYSEAVGQARSAAAEAALAVGRAKQQREDVLNGKAVTFEASGASTVSRGMTAEERVKEVERLNAAINGLQKSADQAKVAYQALVGYTPKDIDLPFVKQADAAGKAGQSVSMLAQLTATYAADMKKIGTSGFQEIQTAHEKFGVSVKNLSEQYGVAESSIDRFINAQKASTKETKDANAELTQFTKKAAQLEGDLKRAAAAGMPMATVLEEFGSQITDVTHKAPLFGKAVGDATAAAATALKDANLQKAAAKFIEQLNDQARSMVEKWKKAGEDSARAAAEALAKGNAKFLAEAGAVQRGLIGLEEDSLEKRQKLIRLDFDEKRASLDKYSTFYQANLDILNAQEAKALRESGTTWEREQRNKVSASLEALSQAFAQLSQISGGCFGDVVKDIGTMLSSVALARKAMDGLKDSFKDIKAAFKGGDFNFSGFAKGLANAVGSALAAGAALWQATDPRGKSTASTVVGGALVGGEIGDSTGVPGAGLIGMGVGALIGWWRSAHAEWKKVAHDIGTDIGLDISQGLAQQIADLEKTISGGTKDQRRKLAELLSLDAIIGEAGGLTASNVRKFEQQAAGLFEPIQRGGKLGADATKQLNTLIGQFADQADKTGGMWDPVFKQLIQQSKDLGLNLEAVNAAVDKQISKLAGGLGAAVKGAFAGTDDKLSGIVKGLAKDEGDALADGFKHAQEKGFQGTIQDYFVQQAKLYRNSTEGDPALGTWLSGGTLDKFDALTAESQGAFDRLSRTALASFNAIVASGRSAFDAISELGPVIDTLIAQHDKLGLSGGAAYDQLARFRTLTKDNADLVASVGGLNDTLTALANLGGLNADVLADLEAQGLDTFSKLQAAGFTENEALQQMVPFLENILKAHKDLGLPIDENTQKLIDQAEAQGLLSDEAMSTNDVLMEGFAALIKAVGGEVPEAFKKMAKAAKDAGKDATDAINGIPSKKTVDITVVRNDVPGDFKPGEGRDGGEDDGRRYATGGVVTQYAATGKTIAKVLNFSPKGTDTVPAMLTPGELVLNAAQQNNLAALIKQRVSAADMRLEALMNGSADDTAGMGTDAGRWFAQLDSTLTNFERALMGSVLPQQRQVLQALLATRDAAAEERLSALRAGTADDTTGASAAQQRRFRELDAALSAANARLRAFATGVSTTTTAMAAAIGDVITPGTGSNAGAFIQLQNGQYVPRDHPLYLAEQSNSPRNFDAMNLSRIGSAEAMRSLDSDWAVPSGDMESPPPRPSVTILQVDKRELGRAVADALPGELRRLGVRVRAS